MQTIKIGNHEIGNGKTHFIISEIGAMYESLDGMKRMVLESKNAGADAVKLQTYRAETISLPGAEFEFEDGSKMPQFDFFKKYEISEADHIELFRYAHSLGIQIFSTPSHYDDVDFLVDLGVPAIKTGADDLTNYPFLEYIAKQNKPVLVSTGMATMAEVDDAVQTMLSTGNNQIILMHSTTAYPPDPAYANLRVIETLQKAFDLPVGYSDHVFGTFSASLAAAMGACVIEKHFTLDRSLKRADYQVALEPAEMKIMIQEIRQIETLKGSSTKKVYPPEEKWRVNGRKSLVAARDLEKGKKLEHKDIKIIRPGTGIHPRHLGLLVGQTVKRTIRKNQIIPRDAF